MKFLYDHFEHLSKNGSLQDFEECIKYIDQVIKTMTFSIMY